MALPLCLSGRAALALVATVVAVVAVFATAHYKPGHEAGTVSFHRQLKGSLQRPDVTGAKTLLLRDQQGVELYVRHWPASHDQQAKGCLLMVHGFTWHSEYFQETAKELNKAGYSVVTFDLAAHGLSGSVTGVPGYHPNFTHWVDEAHLVLHHTQQHLYPGLPSLVYGESLGGAVVLTLLQRPEVAATLAGAISACAVVEVPPFLPPKPVLAVLKLVAMALPLLPNPGDKVTAEEEYVGAFGDRELAARAFHHDPLVVRSVRLGALRAILSALESLSGSLDKVRVPSLLVLQGVDDPRVRPGSAQEIHDRAASSDKDIFFYKGVRHYLLQETADNKRRVWGDITAWLDRHSHHMNSSRAPPEHFTAGARTDIKQAHLTQYVNV